MLPRITKLSIVEDKGGAHAEPLIPELEAELDKPPDQTAVRKGPNMKKTKRKRVPVHGILPVINFIYYIIYIDISILIL